jgi:alkylated DNA nucleotide flippase Atl1
MINGLLFLGGIRWGEMAALRWREYEPKFGSGLGRLVIARSFEHRKRVIKATKTEVPRWMPVHPVLAMMLAEWKLAGWAQMMGRPPTADDLVVPNAPVVYHSSGIELAPELREEALDEVRRPAPEDVRHCRMPQLGLRRSREDCARLGLRSRRNHDARRTFISLARAGGASKDLLEWVTHGPPNDVIDGYTTLPWETLCQQVLCVKVELPKGKVLAFRTAASENGLPEIAQVLAQVDLSHSDYSEIWWGVQDSETSRIIRIITSKRVRVRIPTENDQPPIFELSLRMPE